MDKKQLRLIFKERRRAFINTNTSSLPGIHTQIGKHLATLIPLLNLPPNFITAAFSPIQTEVNALSVAESLVKRKLLHSICLPTVVKSQRTLVFRDYQGESFLKESVYGSKEPDESSQEVEPDLLLVPLLAFDDEKNRLGYGGGYYDETIEKLMLKKTVACVGLAFDCQMHDELLPVNEYDQKLHFIVTEHRIYA